MIIYGNLKYLKVFFAVAYFKTKIISEYCDTFDDIKGEPSAVFTMTVY